MPDGRRIGIIARTIRPERDGRLSRWPVFLRQLGGLINELQSGAVDRLVSELVVITPEDREEIENWNSQQLQTGEVCIHEVIAHRGSDTPHKTAVFAWDGEWTYAELESVSSRLAAHIRSLDLDLGQAIPVCFEKSKWVIIAMLAVLKAGRAFTLIDPSNPLARGSPGLPANIRRACSGFRGSLRYHAYCRLPLHCVR